MKVVVAPDSFKGNMRSATICEIIHKAILEEIPDAVVIDIPMADGGEGTVDALVAATGGRIESIQVTGPLGDPVMASYGLLPDGTAVMEMASASGIELVPASQLDPMNATTFGTGELLAHLITSGYTSIIMGIGGSATVDGGTGMAQALGIKFLDISGHKIAERGGKILSRIHSVDLTSKLPSLGKATIRVACDVTIPLTGSEGAAAVFGPQKGATELTIPILDQGLANLRKVCDFDEAPGDGAAGGLGYGLRTFCDAKIHPGARLIAQAAGIETALEGADLLITGEGCTDGQTASGKLCSVLADIAHQHGVKTLLLSGAVQGDLTSFFGVFDYAFSISSGHASLEACIRHAPEDLAFVVRNVMRLIQADFRAGDEFQSTFA